MTDHTPRLFDSANAIRRVGEGLLARTLPKSDWTHEAHLAATLWIVTERPDIVPEAELRGIISGYNASLGEVNDDTQGYHETITRCFLAAIRDHVRESRGRDLLSSVNALLMSDRGRRDWPLRLYSRDRLFSIEGRRSYLPPDLL